MAMAAIQPAKDEAIEHYEVSRAVNRTANDAPMLVEPLREPEPVEEAPAPKRARRRSRTISRGVYSKGARRADFALQLIGTPSYTTATSTCPLFKISRS